MGRSHAGQSSSAANQVRQGLVAIFGSTLLQLEGYFMLTPLLVLRLKDGGLSTTLTGVYVATGWLGLFCRPHSLPLSPSACDAAARCGCRWGFRF